MFQRICIPNLFLSYNFQQCGKYIFSKISPKGRNQDDLLKNQSNSHAFLKALMQNWIQNECSQSKAGQFIKLISSITNGYSLDVTYLLFKTEIPMIKLKNNLESKLTEPSLVSRTCGWKRGSIINLTETNPKVWS